MRKKIWEITFHLEDGRQMSCLEEADSGDEAYFSITSVWGPPGKVERFEITERCYFQINIPSMEQYFVHKGRDLQRRGI